MVAFGLAACSIAADIDVCERPRQDEHELNLRTSGHQYLGSARALSPMPFGGALSVYTSEVSGDPGDERTEILGTLVARDGSRQPTCGETRDVVYAATTMAHGDYELRLLGLVVPPPAESSAGAILFTRDDETSMQVVARFIDDDGCHYSPGNEPMAVQISEHEGPHCDVVRSGAIRPGVESRCVSSIAGALLGSPAETQHDFAVLWAATRVFANGVAARRLMARVVRVSFGQAEFLATSLSPAGEPVELVMGVNVHRVAAVGLGGGRFIAAWQELHTMSSFRTTAQVFDERFTPLSEAVLLGESPSGSVEMTNVDIALSADRIMIVWVQPDDSGAMRAMARILDHDGDPIGGVPIRLTPNDDGFETQVTVTALHDDLGFLVAWQETGDEAHEDQSEAGLRALALTRDGDVRFVNPACERRDFQLNQAAQGAQYRPALATFAGGSIAAVWTDEGDNGIDPDGSSIRSAVLSLRTLLPVE
jgi:hypothetical protein